MKREFVATLYILHQEKTLLLFHKKLQRWLPPGGHLEPHELPSEGALREAKEETGLDIELLTEENVWVEGSIPRPFMCLLESIPPYEREAAHEHIDFIFVGKPKGKVEVVAEKDVTINWFSLHDLTTIQSHLFEETFLTIHQLFKKRLHLI